MFTHVERSASSVAELQEQQMEGHGEGPEVKTKEEFFFGAFAGGQVMRCSIG